MNAMSILDSLNTAWLQVSPVAANLLLVLILLLVGALLARGAGQLVSMALKAIQLDLGASQLGFNKLLAKGEIKQTLSELLGDFVYWIIVLVVVVGVLGAFGLPVEAAFLNVAAYMGVVFLASFILGIGLLLAGLIASLVKVILLNLGLVSGKTVARVVYYVVIVFAFLAALTELGISGEALAPHLGIVLGMPALAAAIAFGLGCKDMAADFLHNLFKGK